MCEKIRELFYEAVLCMFQNETVFLWFIYYKRNLNINSKGSQKAMKVTKRSFLGSVSIFIKSYFALAIYETISRFNDPGEENF